MNFLQENRNFYIKKNIFEILKDRFKKNENILDRILYYLATEQDVKDFNSLIADVYEIAYLKCVEDNKKKFEELGYKVKVVADHSNEGV
jgi:hypothetical protein